MIVNVMGSGCDRALMRVDADLCPRLGERVSISCEAGGNTYIISGPHGSVTNEDLVIDSYVLTDDGTYTCSSSSPCGTANDSITIMHVGKNKPSTIAIYNRIQHKMICNFVLYVLFIGMPPTLPPGPQPPDCIRGPCNVTIGADICITAGLKVNISCVAIGAMLRYTWYKNGVFFSNMQNLTDVDVGTYNCTASNSFGSVSRLTRVRGKSLPSSACNSFANTFPSLYHC